MRDLSNNIKPVQALAPQVLSATATGDALDTLGFGSAALVINTGAIVGSGDFTAKVQESATTTSGDFTDVAAGDLIGALPASLVASSIAKVGYKGFKRYLRIVVIKNSGTSIAASVSLIMGNAAHKPTT